MRITRRGIDPPTNPIVQTRRSLAALILTSAATIRGETQTDRAEARADREAFQGHILRLTKQQGILSARLDGLRDPPAPNR